jgi:hypothetical protein
MPHIFPISSGGALRAIREAPAGRVVTLERKITIDNERTRARIVHHASSLKPEWVVKITKRNRTQDQNRLLWVLLTELSIAKPEGRKCTPDDWKCLVMHACGHDVQFMTGLDDKPFPVGFRSSHLAVKEMSNLIEWIYSYGAQNGVTFSEPQSSERKTA